MAHKLKLMLVDDHYLVRMGLASIMALEPDMVVCAEASSGEQARALYRIHRPDVTLMDLRLPDISGTETMQAIRSEFPDARIVMISTYVCDEEIYGALQAGAMAYLVKSVQRDELMRAIRKAAPGQRHIPAEVAARLAERVTRAQSRRAVLRDPPLMVGDTLPCGFLLAVFRSIAAATAPDVDAAIERRIMKDTDLGPVARNVAPMRPTSATGTSRPWVAESQRCLAADVTSSFCCRRYAEGSVRPAIEAAHPMGASSWGFQPEWSVPTGKWGIEAGGTSSKVSQLDEDGKVGTQINGALAASFNASNADAYFGDARRAAWWLEHKDFGRMTVGRYESAGVVNTIDLGGISAVASSSVVLLNGGFNVRGTGGEFSTSCGPISVIQPLHKAVPS